MSVILEVKNLCKFFPLPSKLFQKEKLVVHAINDVSLKLYKGETLAIVGESGSGKSTLGHCILKLINPSNGSITYKGQDITYFSVKQMLPLRHELQIIFQDPYSSLNPRMNISTIIGEALREHKLVKNQQEYNDAIIHIADLCGISSEHLDRFPHQFSGGQRQRIGIARALILKPSIVICDEAVSALDVSVKAQIIRLLIDLQKKFQLSYLFISHDITIVKYIADRVAVMYLGKIVEIAPRDLLFNQPKHPYTQSLIDAIPSIEPRKKKPPLQGEIPSNIILPKGCVFSSRCPRVQERCYKESPELIEYTSECSYACFYPQE